MHKTITAMLVLTALVSVLVQPASAQLSETVTLHGYGQFYYGKTNDYPLLGATKTGSYNNSAFSLDISANPSDRVSVKALTFWGQTGEESHVEVDIAWAQYLISDAVSLRMGRSRVPFGNYGEILEVGTSTDLGTRADDPPRVEQPAVRRRGRRQALTHTRACRNGGGAAGSGRGAGCPSGSARRIRGCPGAGRSGVRHRTGRDGARPARADAGGSSQRPTEPKAPAVEVLTQWPDRGQHLRSARRPEKDQGRRAGVRTSPQRSGLFDVQ